MRSQRPQAPAAAKGGGGRTEAKDQARPAAWGWLVLPVVAAAVIAYAPALDGGFVDIDDREAFLDNPNMRGLGWSQVVWAFTTRRVGTYQPLAWLIYGAQYAAFGPVGWGFHATSLAFHAALAAALFFLIRALLTRAMQADDPAGRRRVAIASALVASAFAAHPLRAEAVSWTACQAYLPCGLFGVLAILAYLRAAGASGRRPYLAWLAGSIGLHALSLGGKGVTMGMPLVLLILDAYPLGRFAPGRWRALLVEKVPFLVLSTPAAAMAVWARGALGGVASIDKVGPLSRVTQACYSSWFYAAKTLVPTQLRAVYAMPHSFAWTDPRFGLSVLGVIGFLALAWAWRRRRPWLAASGAAYGLILMPNSGLVTNIGVLTADRYSTIATMALMPAVAAALAVALARLGRRPGATAAVVAASLLVIVALTAAGRAQARTWRDSVSVWSHAVAVTPTPDPYLQTCLGRALLDAKRIDEARDALARALQIDPAFTVAHDKYGLALVAEGRTAEAERHFAEAVRLQPDYMEARINHGYALAQLGRIDAAADEFAAAAAMKDEAQAFSATSGFHYGLIEAQANLGAARAQQGRFAEAAAAFQAELTLDPARPEARKNLGYALIHLNRYSDAAAQYAEAARLAPGDAGARHNLGHCLAQLGRLGEAAVQYQEALRLDPRMMESRRGLDELLQARAGRGTLRR